MESKAGHCEYVERGAEPAVLEKLETFRGVTLVGSVGMGKTSLVRRWLIPKVREQHGWAVAVVGLHAHPALLEKSDPRLFYEIAASLTYELGGPDPWAWDPRVTGEQNVSHVLGEILKRRSEALVLTVEQIDPWTPTPAGYVLVNLLRDWVVRAQRSTRTSPWSKLRVVIELETVLYDPEIYATGYSFLQLAPQVPLEPLDQGKIARMLRERGLDGQLAPEIQARVGGHPEILRAALDALDEGVALDAIAGDLALRVFEARVRQIEDAVKSRLEYAEAARALLRGQSFEDPRNRASMVLDRLGLLAKGAAGVRFPIDRVLLTRLLGAT